MQNRKIVVGNWKMNPSNIKDAEKLFGGIAKSLSTIKKTEVVICAPFIYLEELAEIRTSKVKLGAQDAFGGEVGAFTGEVSSAMLANMKVKYVILGHSERRALGETNADINKKIKGVIASGMLPILCVGELERDENHEYFNLVKTQLVECLSGVSKNLISKVIIAYEPVWAISTTANRKDATAKDSEEMSIFIKKVLADISSPQIASGMRVLYGGSVNERDAGEFLQHGGVDGLLPGKASLDVKKFTAIVNICEALKN
ncbi:MAG: triose-phosphate isomerase [Candidatus Pacebacteria bacterium]|nr:triose-phosphate isomerase [Candidatus Paceibacterota bacterium]